nr:MAG TPA: hypothetical protein [Caudoviricetes sp.]
MDLNRGPLGTLQNPRGPRFKSMQPDYPTLC